MGGGGAVNTQGVENKQSRSHVASPFNSLSSPSLPSSQTAFLPLPTLLPHFLPIHPSLDPNFLSSNVLLLVLPLSLPSIFCQTVLLLFLPPFSPSITSFLHIICLFANKIPFVLLILTLPCHFYPPLHPHQPIIFKLHIPASQSVKAVWPAYHGLLLPSQSYRNILSLQSVRIRCCCCCCLHRRSVGRG